MPDNKVYFKVDDLYAVWYELLEDGGTQAHLILLVDLPEDAKIVEIEDV